MSAGALDITAKLMKKPIALGSSPFTPAITMASVSSSGMSDNAERRATTKAVNQPLVTAARAFYFVELDVPNGVNVDVLGLQIDVEPTCG